MDGVPYIELQCDAETFLQVVYGRLPLEHALSSGKLIVKGGHDIAGGEPVGGKADTVRETLIRELASRFTREVSSDCT